MAREVGVAEALALGAEAAAILATYSSSNHRHFAVALALCICCRQLPALPPAWTHGNRQRAFGASAGGLCQQLLRRALR